LAFEVYWAFRSVDHALAAAAARVQAANADSPSSALEFEANAASCDTRSGDTKALLSMVERLQAGTGLEVESELDAWETVYHAYSKLKNMSGAEHALQQMRRLKPEARATLVTEENFASLQGRAEDAFAAAHKIRKLYPYQHMGDERLGILYGTSGDGENALAHASRALSIAPYCHISHASGAMAYFAAGDVERSRLHMERAESLDKTETPLQWSASTALMHALRGDREQFEACVSDRSRTIEEYPYPEFEARLRDVLEAETAGS
jgi:tetratricopeptide (TPR) repeat protein